MLKIRFMRSGEARQYTWCGSTEVMFRFCFEPDVPRPLFESEKEFFEKHAGNGKPFQTTKSLFNTDQMQFRSQQSSLNLMISLHRSMILTKKKVRIEKSPLRCWKRGLRNHSRGFSSVPVLMCALNVGCFLYSGWSWDLYHFQLSICQKGITRYKSRN